MSTMRLSVCLVINPIKGYSSGFHFNRLVVRQISGKLTTISCIGGSGSGVCKYTWKYPPWLN